MINKKTQQGYTMSKIVTSARGEKVDFDLISIKNSMAAIPITENVSKRERFINKKRRRGIKRKVDVMAQTKRLEDANYAAAVETDAKQAAAADAKQFADATPAVEVTPTQRRKVGK